MGGLLGGGGGGEGAKGMLVAPLSNYWVGIPPPPPLFHIEIEGKCGWIIGGGGGKGYVGGPPLKLLGGPSPPPPFLKTIHRHIIILQLYPS